MSDKASASGLIDGHLFATEQVAGGGLPGIARVDEPCAKAPEYSSGTKPGVHNSPQLAASETLSSAPGSPSSPNHAGFQRRRGSSLTARFPGDQSHRPLDMIRADQRSVNKPRRRTRVGADTIDQLDMIGANGIPYHHDGPYDATLLARNLSFNSSPVAATQSTNYEAIRATPQEFIKDSIEGHRPLAGTASLPPGVEDRFGRVLNYTEGPNLNIEMGWRRWEGIEYHPDDIKGKGEPTFTLDRALKTHKSHRRFFSDGGIELRDRGLVSFNAKIRPDNKGQKSESHDDGGNLQRAHTTGKRSSAVTGALRSRFGSLRRRRQDDAAPGGL